jgi:hypothetical protein
MGKGGKWTVFYLITYLLFTVKPFGTWGILPMRGTAIAWSISLRETVNSSLDRARSLADNVLLEFGASREQDLALRNRSVNGKHK